MVLACFEYTMPLACGVCGDDLVLKCVYVFDVCNVCMCMRSVYTCLMYVIMVMCALEKCLRGEGGRGVEVPMNFEMDLDLGWKFVQLW